MKQLGIRQSLVEKGVISPINFAYHERRKELCECHPDRTIHSGRFYRGTSSSPRFEACVRCGDLIDTKYKRSFKPKVQVRPKIAIEPSITRQPEPKKIRPGRIPRNPGALVHVHERGVKCPACESRKQATGRAKNWGYTG